MVAKVYMLAKSSLTLLGHIFILSPIVTGVVATL